MGRPFEALGGRFEGGKGREGRRRRVWGEAGAPEVATQCGVERGHFGVQLGKVKLKQDATRTVVP